MEHRHRLACRRRFVEERGVRDFHPRQIAHHGLEVEERFETALRNLRLIGRVRRVPAGILEHVAEDDTRRDGVVVAEADERPEHLIARRRAAQIAKELVLADAVGQVERFLQADARRDGFVDQRVERGRTDDLQHLVAFSFVGSDMAGLKLLWVEEVHYLMLAGILYHARGAPPPRIWLKAVPACARSAAPTCGAALRPATPTRLPRWGPRRLARPQALHLTRS